MRGEAFARQLKLLALLEVRPEGVEPEEAAAELGTRRRTVYRDFRVLEDAGVPAPPPAFAELGRARRADELPADVGRAGRDDAARWGRERPREDSGHAAQGARRAVPGSGATRERGGGRARLPCARRD